MEKIIFNGKNNFSSSPSTSKTKNREKIILKNTTSE